MQNYTHKKKKKAISTLFDASGNKNISATIRIAREVRCLPYAGFFLCDMCSAAKTVFRQSVSPHLTAPI